MTLADRLRPFVVAIQADARGGNTLAASVITLYEMHRSCPSDPGAKVFCEAAFDEWLRERGVTPAEH